MLLAEGRVEGENTDRDRLAKQEAGGVGAMSINIIFKNKAILQPTETLGWGCVRRLSRYVHKYCSIGHCTSAGSK